MPIRLYRCENEDCKHQDEYLEKMDAPSERECPECGKPMKRMVARPSEPNFTGTGFHATDY